MSSKKIAIIITGPTCSGKTSLSLHLADKIGAEIIAADSMQIYKQFNIITAKPSQSQMQKIPHHLIDCLDVWEDFDVASFSKKVKAVLPKISKKNAHPLVVGGTGMYVMALTDGIFEGVDVSADVMKQLTVELDKKGNAFLYSKLQQLDADSAKKIHVNDTKRIIRALSVTLSCGKPFSVVRENKVPVIDEFLIYGISLPREVLYTRIEDRVDQMFEQGAVLEVENILKSGKKISQSASQALGFKEIVGYLNGEYDKTRAIYLLKKNTRNFAKRQLTWFRRNEKIKWLDLGVDNNAIDEASLAIIKDIKNCG